MSVLVNELAALLAALQRHQVSYALRGGMAMAVHGKPRATIDIDLLLQEVDIVRVTEIASGLGFTLPGAPMEFAEGRIKIRRVSKIIPRYADDVLMLDMLVVTPALASVWESRELREWEAGEVWVVSREGLKALKQLSGRPNDLRDIESLDELQD